MNRDTPAGPVRVAVFNDFAVVVRGVEAIFSAHPDRVVVVRTALSSARLEPDDPDVDIVLLDPFASTVPLSERIPSARGRVKYVVLAWRSSVASIQEALELGFCGFLSKELDELSMIRAIEAIHGGEVVVAAMASSPRGKSSDEWPAKKHNLTAREAEILALIATGLTNLEIGARLYIGSESLKTHIRSAYRKIGVTRRSQAIVWCLGHGLVAGATLDE